MRIFPEWAKIARLRQRIYCYDATVTSPFDERVAKRRAFCY